MDHIERNYKLLQEKLIEHMDTSLNLGREVIESELDAGMLNVLVKPIVRSFYDLWSNKNARVGTLEQIKITLDSAKELLNNGEITKEKFNAVIDKNFPLYLKNDQTDQQCNKFHKNYNKLKEITKESFITQVEETVMILNVKEDVNSYDELSKTVFITKEKALDALKRQLDFNDEGIRIIEEDDTILKILIGKHAILSALRKGFELTKIALITDLSNIFNIN